MVRPEVHSPQCQPVWRLHRELDDDVQPPLEPLIDVLGQVRRHDPHHVVTLQPLREVVGLEVGGAVAHRPQVRALAEESVAFVDQQYHVVLLGSGEDLLQVLLRLADLPVDRRRQVVAVALHAEFSGQDPRRQGLAGAAPPGEQRSDTGTIALTDRARVQRACGAEDEVGGLWEHCCVGRSGAAIPCFDAWLSPP